MHEWWNHSYMHKLLQHLTMSSSLSEISCIDLAVAINLHANGAFVNYLEVAVKINTLCYTFLVRFLALCVGILKFCTSHETIYSTWVVIYLGHTHNMRTRGLIFLPCVDDRPTVPAASQTWLDPPQHISTIWSEKEFSHCVLVLLLAFSGRPRGMSVSEVTSPSFRAAMTT